MKTLEQIRTVFVGGNYMNVPIVGKVSDVSLDPRGTPLSLLKKLPRRTSR